MLEYADGRRDTVAGHTYNIPILALVRFKQTSSFQLIVLFTSPGVFVARYNVNPIRRDSSFSSFGRSHGWDCCSTGRILWKREILYEKFAVLVEAVECHSLDNPGETRF